MVVHRWAFYGLCSPREHSKAVLARRWTARGGGQIRCSWSSFAVFHLRRSHDKIHRHKRRRQWTSIGGKEPTCGCYSGEVCIRIDGGMILLGIQVVRERWWRRDERRLCATRLRRRGLQKSNSCLVVETIHLDCFLAFLGSWGRQLACLGGNLKSPGASDG